MMSEYINYFQSRQQEIIRRIGSYVEIETPSGDGGRIALLADLLAHQLGELGAQVEIIRTSGGPSVHAGLAGKLASNKNLLIVGHCDTVWPAGTLARKPFRLEADR